MKKNIGISDRIIRFVLLDGLLGVPYYGIDISPLLSNLSFVAVIVLGITILTGYSPIYHLLNISTKDDSFKRELAQK
ncbi:MAG: DUF2892 domain-containing protein [Saprospiraceae bacterium]|nr:DUF2892 domain-containing protein [Saprospiraceae bacterium]